MSPIKTTLSDYDAHCHRASVDMSERRSTSSSIECFRSMRCEPPSALQLQSMSLLRGSVLFVECVCQNLVSIDIYVQQWNGVSSIRLVVTSISCVDMDGVCV